MAARRYKPTRGFRELKDFEPLEKEEREVRLGNLNELKALTLPVWKRVSFYLVGAGEGLLLDRLNPTWRRLYFNHEFHLEKCFEDASARVIELTVSGLRPFTVAQNIASTNSAGANPEVNGDLRLHDFHSRVFRNNRTLRVLLPPGYDQYTNRFRRYPVPYLNDGQNLFDATTSLFNPLEWQVDETVDRLITTGEIEPIIVVGIDNAGRSGRANEYLP